MTDLEAKAQSLRLTLKQLRADKIKAVLLNFDFEKVHRVMTLLNWSWQHNDQEFRVPSIAFIISTASRLLENVEPGEHTNPFGTGGFEACIDNENNLSLRFVLHETVAMVDEETNQVVTV